MTSTLLRRLKALELAMPRRAASVDLTDEHRACFTALNCIMIAVRAGEYQPGVEPLHALYRGIERALWSKDCVQPFRDGFARRIDVAAARAFTGGNSDAQPHDLADGLLALAREDAATGLLTAFMGVHTSDPSFSEAGSGNHYMTRIEADGGERFCWPDRAGADQPSSDWKGQGFAAARVYWSVTEDTPSTETGSALCGDRAFLTERLELTHCGPHANG